MADWPLRLLKTVNSLSFVCVCGEICPYRRVKIVQAHTYKQYDKRPYIKFGAYSEV